MVRYIVMAAVVMAVASGCGSPEPAVQTEPQEITETADEITMMNNSVCPVMGGPVSAGQYFDWEGYRIGICCPGCEASFRANPRAFIPSLLQDPGVSDEIKADLSSRLEETESTQ
jgi:hypothetical protein